MFVKTFVAHALHPDQLEQCLSDSNDGCNKLKNYLQSVSNNVNQIVSKIIWNAHSRTVNLLANDEKEGAHFWDIRRFDHSMFRDFYPENTYPAAQRMYESWHRAFGTPPMVRYTTKDYPIGKHCSPLEEIDEVAELLFNHKAFGATLPTGQVVKPPSSKKQKSRNLPGAASRAERNAAPRDWLGDIVRPSIADGTGTKIWQDSARKSIEADELDSIIGHDEEDVFAQDAGIDLDESGIFDPLVLLHSDINNHPVDNLFAQLVTAAASPSTLHPGADRNLEPEENTQLETHLSAEDEVRIDRTSNARGWRIKLIEDHKRRLAERWPRSQTQSQIPPLTILDVKTAVENAVARGILMAASAGVQEQIDTAANTQRNKQVQIASRQKEPATRAPENVKKRSQKVFARGHQQKKRAIRPGPSDGAPKKKQKRTRGATSTGESSNKTPPKKSSKLSAPGYDCAPQPTHPSGSKTLEHHQLLPPEAYFEQTYEGEKPVWRCGIKHAMGYYYNAGDRKNCPGCFTSVNENPRLKWMDFYMPSYSHFHQPAPDVTWKPSKPVGRVRRSKHLSHNSIAKEAYWEAFNAGATEDEARQKGVEAVEEHLRPKPPREPTPEPTPEPSPEPIDLGPHPSGSATMEHGQDIPDCAYFEKQERHEEFAWRCEVNHALGRYYLAGDKRTCPGCGSNHSGVAKHTEMDFYMPPGVVVRQEAPGLVEWHPRKPYKSNRENKPSRKVVLSHNQICSKKYWDAIDAGKEHNEALEFAVKETDAYVDAKNEAIQNKQAKSVESDKSPESQEATQPEDGSSSDSETEQTDTAGNDRLRRNSDGGVIISLVPRKRRSEELSEDENDEVEEYQAKRDSETPVPDVIYISSEDESSSASDSE